MKSPRQKFSVDKPPLETSTINQDTTQSTPVKTSVKAPGQSARTSPMSATRKPEQYTPNSNRLSPISSRGNQLSPGGRSCTETTATAEKAIVCSDTQNVTVTEPDTSSVKACAQGEHLTYVCIDSSWARHSHSIVL